MSQQFSNFETQLMQTLLKKAAAYKGRTHPNPAVAACIYKKEHII